MKFHCSETTIYSLWNAPMAAYKLFLEAFFLPPLVITHSLCHFNVQTPFPMVNVLRTPLSWKALYWFVRLLPIWNFFFFHFYSHWIFDEIFSISEWSFTKNALARLRQHVACQMLLWITTSINSAQVRLKTPNPQCLSINHCDYRNGIAQYFEAHQPHGVTASGSRRLHGARGFSASLRCSRLWVNNLWVMQLLNPFLPRPLQCLRHAPITSLCSYDVIWINGLPLAIWASIHLPWYWLSSSDDIIKSLNDF